MTDEQFKDLCIAAVLCTALLSMVIIFVAIMIWA